MSLGKNHRPERVFRAAVVAALLVLAACESVEDRVARHQAQGLELVAGGEPGKALIEFQNAIKLDPEFAPAFHQVGLILEERGELEQAFGHYRKSADLDPDLIEARIKIAEYFILSDNLDGADLELLAVSSRSPENPEAMALQAAIEVRRGRLPAARTLLDAAAAIDPDSLRVLTAEIGYTVEAGDEPRALELIDAALAKHPGTLGLSFVKLQLLERAGDMAGVGDELRRMIADYPERNEIREAFVVWAIDNDAEAEAEATLRSLAEAEPDRLERVADVVRIVLQSRGVEAAREELAARVAAEPDRSDLAMLSVDFELQHGDRDRAIGLLESMASGDGAPAAEAKVTLARFAFEAGDTAAGDALVSEVLGRDARNVGALRMRVARLIDEGSLDEAIRSARSGLEEAPDDVDLLELEARAQERSGNVDLANDRFARAVRLAGFQPGITERYVDFLSRINRMSGAEAVLTEAVERAPGEARLLELLAGARLALGDWPGVEAAAARLEPLDADRARQLRAAALIQQERFDAGIDLLSADADASRRAESMAQMVGAYVQAGKPEEAEAFLEELIAENPENLQALGLRGNLHLVAGEPDAAAEKYRAILAIDEGNAGAHLGLARVAEVQGGASAGAAEIATALALSPDNLLLLVRLAQYREQEGAIDEAISIYERVYRAIPDSLLVANNLASLLADHRTSDPAAVARAVAIAGRLQGATGIAFRDTYGWTRHLAGDHAEALRALLPVLEALPDNPWVNYHIGMVYAALERDEEAVRHLEAALRLAGEADFPARETIEATLAAASDG